MRLDISLLSASTSVRGACRFGAFERFGVCRGLGWVSSRFLCMHASGLTCVHPQVLHEWTHLVSCQTQFGRPNSVLPQPATVFFSNRLPAVLMFFGVGPDCTHQGQMKIGQEPTVASIKLQRPLQMSQTSVEAVSTSKDSQQKTPAAWQTQRQKCYSGRAPKIEKGVLQKLLMAQGPIYLSGWPQVYE